ASGPTAGAPTSPAGGPGGPSAPAPTALLPPPTPSPSPTPVPKVAVKIGTSPSLGGWIVDIAEQQGYVSAQNLVLDRKVTDPGSAAAAEGIDKRDSDVGVVA